MRSVLPLCLLLLAAAPPLAAPVAERHPFMVTSPNGARQDDYYWLRDDSRKKPEILEYLNAENRYADAVLAPTKPLRDRLYREIVGRIKQDDSSPPYAKNGYWYYSRYTAGAEYPVLARRKGTMQAPEELLLDQPAMARGHGFFAASGGTPSPDARLYAWAEDVVGRRQYVLKVKDIASGRVLADAVPDIESGFVWADDNRTLFYVEKDPKTLLSTRIKAHVLGTPVTADRLVYEEKDESFYIGVQRTADDAFLCIVAQSTVSNEQRCAPASAPTRFTVLAPRVRDLRYAADHAGGRWVIRTNLGGATNYKLVTVADADLGRGTSAWIDLVPARADRFIEDFRPFTTFIALEERSGGNKRLRLLRNDGRDDLVQSDEPAFTMELDPDNAEADTPWVRYRYGSLRTPTTLYEVNAATGERHVLKVQAVPGYDPADYVTERVWATVRDGTRVPVSLFYRKGFRRDGTAALFQYAYGSYGVSSDPLFANYPVSLADRGMVYAVAHVRGGQELGRAWYDDGHLARKANSFTDFIDVTRFLVRRKYAAPGRVAALGASAGGLLMGAVANMQANDYKAIVAQVPFVDVVTTMLDASIPLTTNEYDEWGNPADPAAYRTMLAYSPYDNVARKPYPSLFVGTGLWDSQVQYWEPAKWVAKLRATKAGNSPLVFRVDMAAGHGGKSGRFEHYAQQSEYLAFALDQLGIGQ